MPIPPAQKQLGPHTCFFLFQQLVTRKSKVVGGDKSFSNCCGYVGDFSSEQRRILFCPKQWCSALVLSHCTLV
ncbi:TPA: hypothetical protein ACH3X1_013447 [Trebouxia sp. C0004]